MTSYTYMSALLTFYIKGEIQVEETGIDFTIPNTFLKFIPLGTRTKNIPISQISSVDTSFRLNGSTLVTGIILFILGLMTSDASTALFCLVFLALGIAEIISSLETVLVVNCTGHEGLVIVATVFDKQTIEDAGSAINATLRSRVFDTNFRTHAEASTDRIVDAINAAQR